MRKTKVRQHNRRSYKKKDGTRVSASTVIKHYRNVSNEKLMFGDFDKDKVKNIDDPKPFNPNESKWPGHKDNPKFYHDAQYGGGAVKLSNELRKMRSHIQRRQKILKNFLDDNPKAEGRLKTVPSTLKKMRERYAHEIKDVAGARILTEKRTEAKKHFDKIKKTNKFDPEETDDYYKNPKEGVYRAYHTGLVHPKNDKNRLEVQVKTKEMDKLADVMHTDYKLGKDLTKHRKKSNKLYDEGY